MQSKLKKLKVKHELEKLEDIRSRTRQGHRKVLLISCKRRFFNHYVGQTYKKFELPPLASQGWMRRKYYGDYFIINPYGKNPATDPDRLRTGSFSDLGLDSDVLQGIDRLGFKQPTSVQEQAIPPILEGKNTLFCAETGSGKTLAYLAPLLHLLKRKTGFQQRPPNSPQALILVPGRELAVQISDIAETLSSHCSIKSQLVVGGQHPEEIREMAKDHEKLDLVISTLGIMKSFVRRGTYKLNYIQHVVLDEVDTLVDDSFSYSLRDLLDKVPIQENFPNDETRLNVGAQLILAGATMPKYMDETFEKIVNVDTLLTIKTSHLHRIMPHVAQKFIRVKKDLKANILVELVKADVTKNKGVIIFCNSSPGCVFLSKFLAENGVQCLCFHGKMDNEIRARQFESFQKRKCNVLCCTDLGSRGLDTVGADHVINFEFPNHMSDYIHRAGRTGRVGMRSPGFVTNLISTKFEVILVQKIEAAARRIGSSLPGVDANIQRNINEYIMEKEARTNKKFTAATPEVQEEEE